ncbi:MAG: hypothetical protein WC254_07380, partial [Candidatus Woesearchaeota archaeon]
MKKSCENMKYLGKRVIIFFLLVFTFLSSVLAMEIDPTVKQDLETKGYAKVIVFVQAPFNIETQQLLTHEEKDSTTLKKILTEKKKVIRSQQQKVLRELEIDTQLDSDTDLILDDKYQYING